MKAEIFRPAEKDEEDEFEVPEEIEDETFQELCLASDVCAETQEAWDAFLNQYPSSKAAGEAVFSAVFDASPSLQVLFKSPASVMAPKFISAFGGIVSACAEPAELKPMVEIMGFQHMDIDVTVAKIQSFRDAIIDLIDMDVGNRFTRKAKYGIGVLLNYVGGACMYIRREYASYVQLIKATWVLAAHADDPELVQEASEGKEEAKEDGEEDPPAALAVGGEAPAPGASEAGKEGNAASKVPNGFFEMYMFNSAVMGYGTSQQWMDLILEQLDNIVMHVANIGRLQEECSTLALGLDKFGNAVLFKEFRSVAMSSLKAVVRGWSPDHEVAWSWLWDNVERMLLELRGKPTAQEKRLTRFFENLPEDKAERIRHGVHESFFELAPASQEYFKQSSTRLHFIAQLVVELSLTLYRDPVGAVRSISEIGLKHVGMSIPNEFFPPFVTATTQALAAVTDSEPVIEAFRWAVALIGKILARTVVEGSTIVMKAINLDDDDALRRAIALTPRGKRAHELLNIVVGTQQVSPLYWAIETGSKSAAKAILQDLFTIRADRTMYFYGCDEVFRRHPDIVHHLILHAPDLLETLLDGLIWRSRTVVEGERRVNYYVKHLIQDAEGKFNLALEWIAESRDTKLACHPVCLLVADTIWHGLASRFFILGRLLYCFFLCVFLLSQSFLQHLNGGRPDLPVRIATFSCRVIVYAGSIGHMLVDNVWKLKMEVRQMREGKEGSIIWVSQIPFPAYLADAQNLYKCLLLICLTATMALDPMLWCLNRSDEGLFTQSCPAGLRVRDAYSVLSLLSMLLYWLILSSLSILSMRMAAFTLACGQVLEELALFLAALVFLILMFASSMSALDHGSPDFTNLPKATMSLWELSTGIFDLRRMEGVADPLLLLMLAVFLTLAIIFLLSLLVAQFLGPFLTRYDDMIGYARLRRCRVVVTTVQSLSAKRWEDFLESLQLDEPLEFSEGDIGFAGGITVTEPAFDHPTTTDTIHRFAGSASASTPWPTEPHEFHEDPFEVLESQILALAKKSTPLHDTQKSKMSSGTKSQSSMVSGSVVSGVETASDNSDDSD